ncbi:MAG: phage minor head protein [Candidatus Paceibacterota bacterium]|jgi:SPP1 gp7 family putative phage head morphogenesis protein
MGILLDAFSLAPAKAVEYLRKKKLRISGSWTEVWKEQHTKAFTVANLSKLDLLQDIRNLLNKAIDGELAPDVTGEMVKRGIPFSEFKKRLVPKLKARGWWGIEEVVNFTTGEVTERQLGSVARLRTIYDVNVQTAFMSGRYRGQMDVAKELPYWQFIAVMDGNTTERCSKLHLVVYRYDDPVWQYIYPPNHWRCRSRVRSLAADQVDRVESSTDNLVSQEEAVGSDNKRMVDVTGVKFTDRYGVPQTYMPGAGWDYNPGKQTFKPDLKKYDDDIAALWEGE